jgi:hypothetical protein
LAKAISMAMAMTILKNKNKKIKVLRFKRCRFPHRRSKI